ncbi:MAG TPA: hypothetical protein VMR98_01735 [Candidatus Polarisedimenticolaceae bacterium]|nr:hypothetical protein [Candidatus Polarisedimenticolaceae bacterium]
MKEKILQIGIGALIFSPAGLLAAGCSSEQGKGLEAVGGAGSCNDTALTDRLNVVIDTLFIVVGAIAVLILIMGGIRYITATGDAKRIQAAKDTVLYAVIGLIVVILARAIVGFVIGKIA